MNIPSFFVVPFVDDEKYLTSTMQLYFDELIRVLQNGLSDNGWTFPPITAANLTAIQAQMPDGTGWYETDAKEIVFKINGALRKVTTTPYP